MRTRSRARWLGKHDLIPTFIVANRDRYGDLIVRHRLNARRLDFAIKMFEIEKILGNPHLTVIDHVTNAVQICNAHVDASCARTIGAHNNAGFTAVGIMAGYRFEVVRGSDVDHATTQVSIALESRPAIALAAPGNNAIEPTTFRAIALVVAPA